MDSSAESCRTLRIGRKTGSKWRNGYRHKDPKTGPGKSKEPSNGPSSRKPLTRLDREQRDVLVALPYRRSPVSEVAAQLNIPAGTVNARALSALKAIRSFLNQSPQP
ncbi:sigma factor-like helix-turn-helix DNA-binding protein [Arthrobacter sp. ISL-65]|uniref:sigma factor-like helix-turn-helix DNA-binding protein n=1 Tax=Arthrobacter sp. ISL-65 TaxID=2819112 RepID=UPI0035A8FBA7